jgi:hypothetical protein
LKTIFKLSAHPCWWKHGPAYLFSDVFTSPLFF